MLPDNLHSDFIEKFIKFGVVGFSGIFVDFGVTYLCKEKLNVHKYLANSLGFIVATISNYLLNRYWTFNTGQSAQFVQFGKFLGIAIVGLAINNLLIYLFNDRLKINFYVSKAFAIVIVSIWNFLGNYLYTFAG
ncbi:GtrA family protein [Flavihumibacter sp. R14]|nr:GtrA family protein [Flavihumibacter soli]